MTYSSREAFMKDLKQFIPLILIGGGMVGVFAAYIIFGMFMSSWGTSSAKYEVKLPPMAALNTRQAPQCGATAPYPTWVGCSLPEYKK